jgi:hypothetical protein
LRSKLNLKEAEFAEADEAAADDEAEEVQAEERLALIGADVISGVLIVVGVIAAEGVHEPMGVVATPGACLVEPDHFSYFSSRARRRSSSVRSAGSGTSFSLSEISSMSLSRCSDRGGGWSGGDLGV